jgi:hypothetical protein
MGRARVGELPDATTTIATTVALAIGQGLFT